MTRSIPVVGSHRVGWFQSMDWGNIRAACAEIGKLVALGLVMGAVFFGALCLGCRGEDNRTIGQSDSRTTSNIFFGSHSPKSWYTTTRLDFRGTNMVASGVTLILSERHPMQSVWVQVLTSNDLVTVTNVVFRLDELRGGAAVARETHTLKVAGSIPAPATNDLNHGDAEARKP